MLAAAGYPVAGYRVSAPVLTRLRLDGGAMFGSVPRALWERQRPPDERNRIRLVSRVLLLRAPTGTVLVDAGCGEKLGPREADFFAVEPVPEEGLPFRWGELTELVLTHLHFDHAGGATVWAEATHGRREARPRAAGARVFLQAENWERACRPGPRERASYLEENVMPLAAARLELLDGTAEPLPGVTVHPSHGHTRGMQWVQVGTGKGSLVFPADLVPTATHLHLPFVMGYDMCVETLLREKEAFLEQAVAEEWVLVLAHDEDVAAGRVVRGKDGRFCLGEPVDLGLPGTPPIPRMRL
ncbi:MAG: MBL fold metallo-hydrolase [Planctomycetes bacterium]|nr:MBL fold metallo-hydrolase [Planctomycetota bacterium]